MKTQQNGITKMSLKASSFYVTSSKGFGFESFGPHTKFQLFTYTGTFRLYNLLLNMANLYANMLYCHPE